MHKLMEVAAAAALIAGTASGAGAQAFNGAAQIERGDYRGAERALVAQRALYPDDVDLMLNLATVYLRTGRAADARRVYQAVAARPDQEVVLNGRSSAWSHQIAGNALAHLPLQVAVR